MDTVTFFIYCLVDPRTNKIVYVGASKDVKKRLRYHIMDRNRDTNKCSLWLRELVNLKLRPKIRILEKTNSYEWKSRERFHIKKCRSRFGNLLNTMDGAIGPYDEITKEISEKYRNNRVGCLHTEETKLRISQSSKGVLKSEITRKRMSESLKKVDRSPEHITNLTLANKRRIGYKHTQDSKAKMALARIKNGKRC